MIGVPASIASLARSMRTIASPLVPAVEPSVPMLRPPAEISAPGAGRSPSPLTISTRRRAVPRCCMRDTTSWPT